MTTPQIVQSLQNQAGEFVQTYIDNPQKSGLTPSEKLWMEELSKVYLSAELRIDVPASPTAEFLEKTRQMTAFGHDSALSTRLILYATNVVSEKDFFTNTPAYLSTLERHREQWSRKHVEAQHAYADKRPIEDFMHSYFDAPETVPETELIYFLTLYFKHFYRLLYQFMLSYTQSQTPVFYGRANA